MTKNSSAPHQRSRRRFIRTSAASCLYCHNATGITAHSGTPQVLLDANSGTVLSRSAAEKPHAPASLVKVMTLYGLFDALAAGDLLLSDTLTISDTAAEQPPLRLGLHSGERIAVADAIGAVATRSANDVACAVAEKLGHSERRFAAWMNAKARRIGMRHSRFANASGLPDHRQWCTALDMARLGARIWNNYPRYRDWLGRNSYRYAGRSYRAHTAILNAPPVVGAKSGYTDAAGYNLIAWALRGNGLVVGVVLGQTSDRARDAAMASLLGISL